jgi:hypothetical protein
MLVRFMLQRPSVIEGAPPKQEELFRADMAGPPAPGLPLAVGADLYQVVGSGLTGTIDPVHTAGGPVPEIHIEASVAVVLVGRLTDLTAPPPMLMAGGPGPGPRGPRQ